MLIICTGPGSSLGQLVGHDRRTVLYPLLGAYHPPGASFGFRVLGPSMCAHLNDVHPENLGWWYDFILKTYVVHNRNVKIRLLSCSVTKAVWRASRRAMTGRTCVPQHRPPSSRTSNILPVATTRYANPCSFLCALCIRTYLCPRGSLACSVFGTSRPHDAKHNTVKHDPSQAR